MKNIFIILLGLTTCLFACKKSDNSQSSSPPPRNNSSTSSGYWLMFDLTSCCALSCNFSINGNPYAMPVMVQPEAGFNEYTQVGQTNYLQPNSLGIISLPHVKSGDVISLNFNDTAVSKEYLAIVLVDIIDSNGIEGKWNKPFKIYNYIGNASSNTIDSTFWSTTIAMSVTIP